MNKTTLNRLIRRTRMTKKQQSSIRERKSQFRCPNNNTNNLTKEKLGDLNNLIL